MMQEIADPRLRVYAVWVPMLSGQEKDVPVATRLMPDGRTTHYWDEGGTLVRAYTQALSLAEDAWDIYFLYGPDARWEAEAPPKPHFWMHQLGSRDQPRVAGPYLDAAVFADSARLLLNRR